MILRPDAPGSWDYVPWRSPIHPSKGEGVVPSWMPGREVREIGAASAPELAKDGTGRVVPAGGIAYWLSGGLVVAAALSALLS